MLYGYASRRCAGRRELVEDVVQETWLRAVRDWPAQGLPRNPIGWLTTVARNLILNHFRKREGISIDVVSPIEVNDAVERNTVADSSEISALVSHALTRLPAAEAQLLEAFHYDRMQIAQIAQSYGVSDRAIEGRLRRARERLRDTITLMMNAEEGIA